MAWIAPCESKDERMATMRAVKVARAGRKLQASPEG
jgi:hypothetical protein